MEARREKIGQHMCRLGTWLFSRVVGPAICYVKRRFWYGDRKVAIEKRLLLFIGLLFLLSLFYVVCFFRKLLIRIKTDRYARCGADGSCWSTTLNRPPSVCVGRKLFGCVSFFWFRHLFHLGLVGEEEKKSNDGKRIQCPSSVYERPWLSAVDYLTWFDT